MTVYAALLRAIGPATHKIMRPGALRDEAEAAGFANPVNYLATGNLIFESAKGKAAVRREITALVEGLGLMTSEVFIVTRDEIGAIVAADSFPAAFNERPTLVGVCFFHKALDWPDALMKPVGPEKVAAVGSALVIDYGAAAATSPSRMQVEKLAGAKMTQRNWNTVLGIWQRMQDR